MKFIQNIKNLFKIYDLVKKYPIRVDPSDWNVNNEKWYLMTFLYKKHEDGSYLLDDVAMLQTKTRQKALKIKDDLHKYYKFGNKKGNLTDIGKPKSK